MNTNNILEISQSDLMQINGGTLQEDYNAGKAAGEAAGEIVGNTINGLLKLSGLQRLWSLLAAFA